MEHVILSHDSALAYWSYPEVAAPNVYYTQERIEELPLEGSFVVKASDVDRLLSQEIFAHVPRPVDLLTTFSGQRYQTKRVTYHFQPLPLPDGSIVPIRSSYMYSNNKLHQFLAVSPELCFVQMANILDFYELVELGYELCGSYSLASAREKGFVEHPAVTTPDRLLRYVENAKRIKGVQKARRAAKWVLGKAASPKESQIAIMLSLSRSMGGFGIPLPKLNEPIRLGKKEARLAGASLIIADMYWPQIQTVLEYDSARFHADDAQREKDSRKRNVYGMLGIDVIELTKGQLYDFASFSKIVTDLFDRFGIRRRATSETQMNKQVSMHHDLLYGERAWRYEDSSLSG